MTGPGLCDKRCQSRTVAPLPRGGERPPNVGNRLVRRLSLLCHVSGILFVLSAVNAPPVLAFGLASGRSPVPGGAAILTQATASTLAMLPTAGIEDHELKAELLAIRRFGIKELDEATLAAAYRIGCASAAIGLAQMGRADLYLERTARLGAACHIGPLAVGTALSAMSVSFGGAYPGLAATTLGVDVSYRAHRGMVVLALDDLTSPRLDKRARPCNPKYSMYVQIIGVGSFFVTGRVTLEHFEKPRFAMGQYLTVSERGTIFWGLSSAPLEYGGGVEVVGGGGRISYAASYHPVLGFSHTVSLSYQVGGRVDKKRRRP